MIQEYQKNVSLLFDEMKIQSNSVYKKATGKIMSFMEMGDNGEEKCLSSRQNMKTVSAKEKN